jgi:hypothetical protein
MTPAEEQHRREERRVIGWRIVRWAVALPLMLLSYPHLGWFSPFLVLLGVIIVAFDLSGFFVWALESAFAGHQPPPRAPVYSMAEALVMKGQYAEAEAAYERIIAEFPDELKPHVDLITLAIVRLDDPELAAQLYARGMATLPTQERRDELARLYPILVSRRERHDIAKS